MKRVHRMPFGAALEDGGTRFRLWAPAARNVELLLARVGGAERPTPMHACGDGWFEALVLHAGAGDRYRYRIDGGIAVPDPASRCNPLDVHGPSEVIDPGAFDWTDDDWRGRPWSEAVVYELHVGTFSGSGTFDGVVGKLDHLVSLGVTALELMPVADFPGRRGWGYDGVLAFAPEAGYGRPDDLKRLVCAAHAKGLMVLLDVVYNHFGPDGNCLHAYAPQFFTERHHTPWGAAINFDGDDSHWVRRFFVDNAAYWIEEYHLDGLRFDAVHAIVDDSRPHLLEEIAGAIREGPGRDRHVHLVLENDANQARHLGTVSSGRQPYDAQWNDDLHHALHVTLTGESDGYYADYASDPVGMLGRCLAEGFAFQGEASPFRDGEHRGEPSAHLPSTAFVGFLQNHDQVGNRAFGERIGSLAQESALRAGIELLLLAPAVPMLFMGEEFGAATPFQYFCDFTGELAEAVTSGRRGEFAKFEKFSAPVVAESIPDPNAESTFAASRLDWASLGRDPHARWLDLYRRLLSVRRSSIVPRLAVGPAHGDGYRKIGRHGLEVRWRLADGSRLRVVANLGDRPITVTASSASSASRATAAATTATAAETFYATPVGFDHPTPSLPPWSVRWSIEA